MRPTIRAVVEHTLADHPNQRFYSPNLETFGMGAGEQRFQIPKQTMDSPLGWTPHAWGQSGWGHIHGVAHFITLEFDHSDGHESNEHVCTAEELAEVEGFLSGLPYVDLTRSTSGKGLHARIQAAEHPCKTRAEYQSLRRRMVQYLDGLDGVDISGRVDPSGRGILWLWRASQ